jgi:hypothetical protein
MVSKPRQNLTTPEAEAMGVEASREWERQREQAAHDSYEAWCEGNHDDLVLAVSLACWRARKRQAATVYALRY